MADANQQPSAGEEPRELTREERLERALSRGLGELPANKPRGLLGDSGFDVGKIDDLSQTDLNAGISQELDLPVLWVAVLLGYLFGFVPGFIILWVSKRFTRRQKIVVSVVGAVLAVAIVVSLSGKR